NGKRIGMCKGNKDWINNLAKLGYELQLVEQHIITSSGKKVRPDLVASSNRLLSYFVCECKGGRTVDDDQLERYSTLTNSNFDMWIHTYSPGNFGVDLCLADFEENHEAIRANAKDLPILTFGDNALVKTGDFREIRLNDEFKEPISLVGKIPPLSYYPFSVEDSNAYIAPFVIRGLVSIALRKARWNTEDVTLELSVLQEEVVGSVFNSVFEVLSQDNKRQLREKIKVVIKWVLTNESMRGYFDVIEKEGTIKITRPLAKLQEASEDFIKKLDVEKPLMDFFQP
ncbi:MAG: hypothetical protein M1167_00175, partial [Chloroflexi bacterium]|nr:hypothetical protein [Chloroflexota bacterium]